MNLIDTAPVSDADLSHPSSPVHESAISDQVPLNLLIIYENAPAARRALRIVSRLASQAGDDIACHCTFWRYDLLLDLEWRRAATIDALQADLTILSGRDAHEMPPRVNQWMEECRLHRGERSHALLALFDADDSWSISMRDQYGYHSTRQLGCQPANPKERAAVAPAMMAMA